MAKICCVALLCLVGCAGQPKVSESTQAFLTSLEFQSSVSELKNKLDDIDGNILETRQAIGTLDLQMKASQAESETGNRIGGDLSSDPPQSIDTDANESHAAIPGQQPVAVSAVELFVCSTGSCAPCKKMWRDVDDGKLDGFVLTKVPPFAGLKSYPAIRFRNPDSDTGWSVIYGYDEDTRLWLRSKLLGETPVASSDVTCEPVAMSHSEMKALHDQLHGGGSWTWPGDLATHLATTHGVVTGGQQPVSGSFFPVSGQAGIQSSRPAVRSFPQRKGFFGWARTASRKSCPSGGCP